MLTLSKLKLVIESLKPALGKCICHIVFTPPLPSHLHSRCCTLKEHCTNNGTEKHAETMLGELNGIRNACVTNLETAGMKDFSVPDIVKLSMPACTGIPEYAAALKDLMSSDGVHFTESGYRCLASGFTTHLTEMLKKKSASIPIVSGTSHGHCGRDGGKQSLLEGFCVADRYQQTNKPSSSLPAEPQQRRWTNQSCSGLRKIGEIRSWPHPVLGWQQKVLKIFSKSKEIHSEFTLKGT
jgi:hypothetical protein